MKKISIGLDSSLNINVEFVDIPKEWLYIDGSNFDSFVRSNTLGGTNRVTNRDIVTDYNSFKGNIQGIFFETPIPDNTSNHIVYEINDIEFIIESDNNQLQCNETIGEEITRLLSNLFDISIPKYANYDVPFANLLTEMLKGYKTGRQILFLFYDDSDKINAIEYVKKKDPRFIPTYHSPSNNSPDKKKTVTMDDVLYYKFRVSEMSISTYSLGSLVRTIMDTFNIELSNPHSVLLLYIVIHGLSSSDRNYVTDQRFSDILRILKRIDRERAGIATEDDIQILKNLDITNKLLLNYFDDDVKILRLALFNTLATHNLNKFISITIN